MKSIRKFWLILISIMTSQQVFSQNTDSLDLMIGQMIMVGFNGTESSDDRLLLNDIEKGFVGGIVLFEKNISPSSSWVILKQLNMDLQKKASVPLIIALDQEGGRVNRLKEKYSFPPTVSAAYLGELNNRDSTLFYAELTASTLAGLGFNMNFAPVVDLASNPDNPVIAGVERAYSANPEIVAQHARYVIEAHRRFNIGTSLKHFPGHGSSTADSHLGMADVTSTWNENELAPYKTLIDSGIVDAIMTAHIVNKNLEPESLPSTLSKAVITGILRENLSFNGVVFSDDMHMHAIGKYYGTEEAVYLGIEAGLDVLVFSNNISNSSTSTSSEIHRYIKNMVLDGRLSEKRIRESYRRIMDFKAKYVK